MWINFSYRPVLLIDSYDAAWFSRLTQDFPSVFAIFLVSLGKNKNTAKYGKNSKIAPVVDVEIILEHIKRVCKLPYLWKSME